MDNLSLYNAVSTVPQEAIKPIQGGKLKGKSDINPMWRIKALTAQFGPCGIGWGYTIDRLWTEPGADGEVSAFALIHLWYVQDGKRSDPIPGIGGNTFIAKEKGKLATSDECYKMALTDAISVACKALGIAADVYWSNDPTKYSCFEDEGDPKELEEAMQPLSVSFTAEEDTQPPLTLVCQCCGKPITPAKRPSGKDMSIQEVAETTYKKYGKQLCAFCAWNAGKAVQ